MNKSKKIGTNKRKKPVRKLNKVMSVKLAGLFLGVLLAFVGLSFRITYINASKGDKYRRQVLSQSQQQYTSKTIPFKRGDIYDRNGTVLATSNKVYNVILDCKETNTVVEKLVNGQKEETRPYVDPTVEALVQVLGLNEEEIRVLLTKDDTKASPYQIIQQEVSVDKKKEFEKYCEVPQDQELTDEEKKKYNVRGVWFEEKYKRSYPLKTLACDTIGFTVDNNLSDWGIEGQYSAILNGTDGRSYGYFNEDSDVEQNIISPVNGKSVVSTLDVGLQQIVEKWIQAFMKKMGGERVSAIVMNPNNGEILAMASDDQYDLNTPDDLEAVYTKKEIDGMSDEQKVEALNSLWNNFCVTDGYEPGSVVKPIVMGSALQCGAIGSQQHFSCDGGQSFGTTTYIRCTDGHGDEALEDIIANSCNDGMMQIGAQMGADQFAEFQNIFNFGTRTGVDLPNEGTGIIHSAESLGAVELACSAFGQGFTCTMIQEISAMCAVINGGYYYQPHVVNQILNSDGSVAKTITPSLMKQPVSASISSLVRSYMHKSVQEGTSVYSKVNGYSSGGKTGTAEKWPRDNGKYLVSFIGFAPLDNPQLVIYVIVDEPKADRQDNSAYPQYIAQAIMAEALPYMNVAPDEVPKDGAIPTTELWEGFKGLNTDVEEDLVDVDDTTTPLRDSSEVDGEIQEGEEGSQGEAPEESEGSFEGTGDANIPAPLEDDGSASEEEGETGITNEDADMGW